jgi:hypothetical protein
MVGLTLLRSVLEHPDDLDEGAWLYLPAKEKWTLDSPSAVLRSEEVPPELEDDPEAGIPEFAKANTLMQALPIGTVKEIVNNARLQRPDVDLPTLFEAFLYFYDRDAFKEI